MEDKKNIFDFFGALLISFGFTMICMMLFTVAFGEDAKKFSTMFALGGKGIPVEIMAQLLVLSFFIVLARYIFFTEILIKKCPVIGRMICMLAVILIIMGGFIFSFGWFPINMWETWLMFFLCFGLSTVLSVTVMSLKEKKENKKMEEGLKRLREKWEAEENEYREKEQ